MVVVGVEVVVEEEDGGRGGGGEGGVFENVRVRADRIALRRCMLDSDFKNRSEDRSKKEEEFTVFKKIRIYIYIYIY